MLEKVKLEKGTELFFNPDVRITRGMAKDIQKKNLKGMETKVVDGVQQMNMDLLSITDNSEEVKEDFVKMFWNSASFFDTAGTKDNVWDTLVMNDLDNTEFELLYSKVAELEKVKLITGKKSDDKKK